MLYTPTSSPRSTVTPTNEPTTNTNSPTNKHGIARGYVLQLHKIIFNDTNMMGCVVKYLEELNALNAKIFDCFLFRECGDKKNRNDDDYEITGRLFSDLKLSDEKYKSLDDESKILKIAEHTDIKSKVDVDKFSDLPTFKNVCNELYNTVLSSDATTREKQLQDLIVATFNEAQDAEKRRTNSEKTAWDIFWQQVALENGYDDSQIDQLKSFALDALYFLINRAILRAVKLKGVEEETRKTHPYALKLHKIVFEDISTIDEEYGLVNPSLIDKIIKY